MKRIITLLALVGMCHLVASAQKKYEMVIEKTDGTETVINVEDIVRTYFRERNDGGGGGVNPGGGGGTDSDTTCPDGNHPHMIDLGLPSGTKWACCNVGASTPEGYGNYYAWGETQPKSVYSWDTYQYGSYNYDGDYSHLVNIGSDIAGTQYDAATANWGAPWRMPSWTQIKELLDNCTSVWTTQNGVNGTKFVGPNGGTIFLPPAGFRWNGVLDDAGSNGYYWSSTHYESYPLNAYFLYFIFAYANWSSSSRILNNGLSVRPVR